MKLINGAELLAEIFTPDASPSLRWLWEQTKKKAIPHIRVGRLIFYDAEMVRKSLAAKNVVQMRKGLAIVR